MKLSNILNLYIQSIKVVIKGFILAIIYSTCLKDYKIKESFSMRENYYKEKKQKIFLNGR